MMMMMMMMMMIHSISRLDYTGGESMERGNICMDKTELNAGVPVAASVYGRRQLGELLLVMR